MFRSRESMLGVGGGGGELYWTALVYLTYTHLIPHHVFM
jgi:hypothetical protein